MDLATGHLAALDCQNKGPAYKVINLGTGIGYSVMDLIAAFEKAAQRKLIIRLLHEDPGTSPNVGLTRRWRAKYWAGRLPTRLMT